MSKSLVPPGTVLSPGSKVCFRMVALPMTLPWMDRIVLLTPLVPTSGGKLGSGLEQGHARSRDINDEYVLVTSSVM